MSTNGVNGRHYIAKPEADHKTHDPDGLHDRTQVDDRKRPCCARITVNGQAAWCILPEHGPDVPHCGAAKQDEQTKG